MEIVDFEVKEEFTVQLADRFEAFINGLTTPCVIAIDIESIGGRVDVLERMEILITQKKNEGFVFATNVDLYAYSCGLYLFILGDIKTASETANFLYHAPGFEVFQRVVSNDLREMLQELEASDLFVARITAENTTATPEVLNFLKKNENYLNKEDLIYFGFMQRDYELI